MTEFSNDPQRSDRAYVSWLRVREDVARLIKLDPYLWRHASRQTVDRALLFVQAAAKDKGACLKVEPRHLEAAIVRLRDELVDSRTRKMYGRLLFGEIEESLPWVT